MPAWNIPEMLAMGIVPTAPPDADGMVDALVYSRASIARDIIRDRERLGLNQAELARMAGIRVETLNRIEKLKTSPTTRILQRIDQALNHAQKRRRPKPPA